MGLFRYVVYNGETARLFLLQKFRTKELVQGGSCQAGGIGPGSDHLVFRGIQMVLISTTDSGLVNKGKQTIYNNKKWTQILSSMCRKLHSLSLKSPC